MKAKINILQAFTDDELDDYTNLSSRSKLEICSVTGCQVEDINQLIVQFETFSGIHSWIHRAKNNGEPIPKTQEELFDRYRSNPVFAPSILKKRNRSLKFSQKQRDAYIKYGNSSLQF